ncbi:Siderophore synthetase component [Amycolatopsis arida]|uniref:Siderophore synthetase component n=1 Tax=Amycolatopsis arida TaxID=587909 RepID=A0A1I5QYX1_9PSEU|nr:IucA/IucC family protein [Amycolatopsis arida]TDX99001.1 siderophore synthetase component [Amycolatopsis arida]SFP50996.1 Siderophore synthetase component [Amycolatopsis arida]
MEARWVQAALASPEYVAVRRRVFRQLLESLCYEGALRTRPAGADRCAVDGVDERGRPVCYEFTARRRFGFGRVAVGPDPVLRDGVEAESVTAFLTEARDALVADQEHLARFTAELAETLVKDALAQYARTERGDVLAGADHDTLESTVTDGHRYHPTYKSRVGFDLADNLAFGPEFARPVRPLWLAAHRSVTEVTVAGELREAEFLRGQVGPRWDPDPAEYTMLPVHPWQWRERVGRVFAERLRRGELVVLGEDPDEFRAQQSVRTLACASAPHRPYLKLALSIVNTSTSRVLAPHTVRNAAPVTEWLRGITRGDPDLDEVILLGEVMGSSVAAPAGSGAEGYGALACVWRESLHAQLAPGEAAAPFTALTARERDGTPFVEGWLRAYGVREWVARLVEVAVVPLVHVLCAHGVALEAHAQNMALVHREGWPARVALKDFHDGVRFSRAHLAEPGRCPELAGTPAHHGNRNSFLETGDVDLVTDFLLDAFCFVNLGELAILLAEAYGFAEREFWAVVRAALRDYRERRPELAERFALFDVTKLTVAVEKLTTRRLLPDTELRLHAVPNPLGQG